MADEPRTRPAGWAVYVPDAQGHFKEIPPGWRYPSEEHARRVAYQHLLQDRVPVQVRFFADEDALDGPDNSALVEECDPKNAELIETVARDYPLEVDNFRSDMDDGDWTAADYPNQGTSSVSGTLRDASAGEQP